MAIGQVIAFGGSIFQFGGGEERFGRFIADSSGKCNPRICYIPTASGDNPEFVAQFSKSYDRIGIETGVLRLFERTPADLGDFLSAFDIIQVAGGNTRSMLAVWRAWSLDVYLREAWERGTVLCGSSAGSLCWFDSGLTDSVEGPLTTIDGLGLIDGSNCVHYDVGGRREIFHEMIEDGRLPEGIGCPEGVALHFAGAELLGAISVVPGRHPVHVKKAASGITETPILTTLLD